MKIGIRKTKSNIFWLLLIGLLLGVILGLRQQPDSQKIISSSENVTLNTTQN